MSRIKTQSYLIRACLWAIFPFIAFDSLHSPGRLEEVGARQVRRDSPKAVTSQESVQVERGFGSIPEGITPKECGVGCHVTAFPDFSSPVGFCGCPSRGSRVLLPPETWPRGRWTCPWSEKPAHCGNQQVRRQQLPHWYLLSSLTKLNHWVKRN